MITVFNAAACAISSTRKYDCGFTAVKHCLCVHDQREFKLVVKVQQSLNGRECNLLLRWSHHRHWQFFKQ